MRVLALAGGVGGAKLCLGLTKVLEPDELRIVVNTGDDEEFYGLHVSPDLDTVTYTLAGLANPDTGWGIRGDTFDTLSSLGSLGEDTWFGVGDRDLATHIVRTNMLRQGKSLSDVTEHVRRRLGVEHSIAPMTDDRVRTTVLTESGPMPFQTYFVKLRCEPKVTGVRFDGAEDATMSAAFEEGLDSCDALVICPSNPYLSVAPILSIPSVRSRIERLSSVRIAVSPIVGGRALKGPAGKMLSELGEDVSCVGVARQYIGLCDVFVIDEIDRGLSEDIKSLGMEAAVLNTVMKTDEDKAALARSILDIVANG